MKMFKVYGAIAFLMIHGIVYASFDISQEIKTVVQDYDSFMKNGLPQEVRTMQAYNNQVVKAGFSVGSDGFFAITLQCKIDPICMYRPESYQESENNNIKRFFLPRTRWIDNNMRNFIQELNGALQPLGVRFESHQVVGINYGLEFIFEIDSSEYEIKKTIDKTDKLVCFQIRFKKIM